MVSELALQLLLADWWWLAPLVLRQLLVLDVGGGEGRMTAPLLLEWWSWGHRPVELAGWRCCGGGAGPGLPTAPHGRPPAVSPVVTATHRAQVPPFFTASTDVIFEWAHLFDVIL